MSNDTEPSVSAAVEVLEAQYASEHDDDGRWERGECVICSADPHLRCAACHAYVYHQHEACPNGCDELPTGSEVSVCWVVERTSRVGGASS